MTEKITFKFVGKEADRARLDLYDASISMYGAARVFSIVGHYYQTGKIISQAPRSDVQVYILPPEPGSFKETLLVAVAVGVITAPFTVFSEALFKRWFPEPNPEMQQVIQLLEEQNNLLRRKQGLPIVPQLQEIHTSHQVNQYLDEHDSEMQVIRSITANSTKDIFRPVGRSAGYLAITHGQYERPISALNLESVTRLESETVDEDDVVVVGVVNSFSRTSKTGVLFSRDMGRGLMFNYNFSGRLQAGDDFSWSQYTRKPLELHGRFVRWFDNSIKRLLVNNVRRLEDSPSE